MKRIFLILLIILLNSCRNDNDSITENSTSPISTENNIKQRITKKDAIKIGELHNEYLDKVFNDFDYNTPNIEKHIQEKFKSISPELYKINQDKIENYINPYVERKQLLSKKGVPVVYKIISEIERTDNVFQNYTIFSQHLDNVLKEKHNILSDEEYDALLVSFEVMKKSYLYWSSEKKGGLGKGETIIKRMENNNIQDKSFHNGDLKSFSTRRKIQAVIADDAMGAAQAFIGNAFFWSGGPATYFGSVAFGAAISSAMSSAWGR